MEFILALLYLIGFEILLVAFARWDHRECWDGDKFYPRGWELNFFLVITALGFALLWPIILLVVFYYSTKGRRAWTVQT